MNAKLLVPICLLAAACGAENGSSILLAGRVATPTKTAGQACLFTVGTYQIGPGVFDTTGAGYYELTMEVDNNMLDPATNGGAAGSRTWAARAARVRVINSSEFNPPLPNVQAQNTLPADSTAVAPGQKQAINFTAIGPELGAQIGTTLIGLPAGQYKSLQLGITLLGKTGDGQELDTAEKTYPLEVCNGCLTGVPTSCPTGQTVKPLLSCYPIGEDIAAVACQ